MNLKEMLAEKKSALLGLKSKIEDGDAEAIKQSETLVGEIEDLEAKIKSAEKAKSMLEKIGKGEKEDDNGSEVKSASSIGEHFVKNMKKSNNGSRFSITAPEYKAYNDNLAVGTVASPQVPRSLVTDIDRRIVPEVLPNTFLRQLFGSETISGNALTFFTEGALEHADGKPYGFDIVAEGSAKPQVSFADPVEHTVSLDKVTAFVKETSEYADDAPFLASVVNGRLMNYLRLYEESYLLGKVLSTSGIQSDTTSWSNSLDAQGIADLIFGALMSVQTQSGFAADAIVMHPSVWQKLRLGKYGSTNEYIGGGYFADGQGKQLWGVPVYTSTFIDAPVSGQAKGTILIGSFKSSASVVSKGGISIDATNSDQDDFIKNRMTIRAEERMALAVRRPAGFYKLVKSASDPQ